MSLTITLEQHLLDRLRAQAEVRKLSVQQWALAILANAAERPDSPQTWTELDSRRLALIDKRYGAGLDADEDKELSKLQDAVASVFEPADRRRQAHVKDLVEGAIGSDEYCSGRSRIEKLTSSRRQ